MAELYVVSSGLKDASCVVLANSCQVAGVTAFTDGQNIAYVELYDDAAAAAGTIVGRVICPAADLSKYQHLPRVVCQKGCYLKITGTGAKAIVLHTKTLRGGGR